MIKAKERFHSLKKKKNRGRGRGQPGICSFINICMVDPSKALHEDIVQYIAIDYIYLTFKQVVALNPLCVQKSSLADCGQICICVLELHLCVTTEFISPNSQMQFLMDAEICICSARCQIK